MLWEASHSEGDSGHSPLWSGRTQRASLGTAVYRVSRWLTLVSTFPSWPQSKLVILRIPVTLVLIHPSYNAGRVCSKAVRGRLIFPAVIPHLGQATRAPGTVSAILHLSNARVPVTVKGCLTNKLVAQRLRLDGNSWDCKEVQERREESCTTATTCPSLSLSFLT